MRCLLLVHHLFDILAHLLLSCMQYRTILEHVITALNCICIYWLIPRGAVQHLLVWIPKKHTNNLVLRCRKTVKYEVLCGPETDSVFVPLLLALYIRIAIEPSIFRRGISGSTLSKTNSILETFSSQQLFDISRCSHLRVRINLDLECVHTCLEVPSKS